MKRGARGFTLIEVMIVTVILLLVLDAVFTFFIGVVRVYKQQSKIAETGIESTLGLELLRRDVESAGFGLPWNNIPTYQEAAAAPANILNDASTAAPRAIVSRDNAETNGSDYLAVKSMPVSMDTAAGKWTTLSSTDGKRTWTPAGENLQASDNVVVIALGTSDNTFRSVVVSGGSFATAFNATSGFVPVDPLSTNIVYGIRAGAVRFPFNRADYYISTSAVPQKCAQGTGVLVKRVLGHDGGTLGPELPLLDCVADMEVYFEVDLDGNGTPDNVLSDISGYTAAQVRDRVKRVGVFILFHEGQKDPSYTSPSSTIVVGEGTGIPESFNLATIPDYRRYRWKVHSLGVSPSALRR